MYNAVMEVTYGDQKPEVSEFEHESSIEVSNWIKMQVGDLLSVWSGKWEVSHSDVGHPEAGYHEWVGQRLWDDREDDSFPINFRIDSQ